MDPCTRYFGHPIKVNVEFWTELHDSSRDHENDIAIDIPWILVASDICGKHHVMSMAATFHDSLNNRVTRLNFSHYCYDATYAYF